MTRCEYPVNKAKFFDYESSISLVRLFCSSTMATSTGSLSRMQSIEGLDLSHLHSMPQLLAALHHSLRTISTPLSYEQLQKNENVHLIFIYLTL